MFNLNTNNYEVSSVLKSLNYTRKRGVGTNSVFPLIIVAVVMFICYEMYSNRRVVAKKEEAVCKQCSNKDDLNKLILKYESENFDTLLKKK